MDHKTKFGARQIPRTNHWHIVYWVRIGKPGAILKDDNGENYVFNSKSGAELYIRELEEHYAR